MKILTTCGAFFLVATLCLGSCSKTGPAGPQGEQGAAGDRGPAGPQGIPGADGNTIYSGSGAPASDMGANNDYYIDKNAGALYGPKTDAGWGDPVSIKGAQGDQGDKGDTGAAGATGPTGPSGPAGPEGQNGKDGSQILSGSSVPATSLGNTGDYYFNAADYTLYGPKTSAGWGNGISLKGEKGDKGDKGDIGNANVISSGWFSTAYEDWVEGTNGYFLTDGRAFDFSEAGDNGMIVDQDAFQIDAAHSDAAILVYVDLLNGTIRPAPFEISVDLNTPSHAFYDIKCRYVILSSGKNTRVYPVVALKGSSWDAPTAISNVSYFRWKIVVIPTSVARRSSPPDPKDYKATCAYYGIPE